MKRGISTFALILALLAGAVLLALSIATYFSLRTSARAVGETYAPLAVATALAADDLAARSDAESKAALDQYQRLGVHITGDAPPPASTRPVLVNLERHIGALLGDPARVVVTLSPEAQIWVRSAHEPRRWIVMQAMNYRTQVIDSTLLSMLAAGLIALLAAALAARLLTRPLEGLARNASALLAGETSGAFLRGSPREVRSLAAAIGDAGERLRGAARERELMLAGISHDLRTPLARLRIALELGDANDPQRRAAMVDDLEQLDNALGQCLAFVRDGRDEALRDVDVAAIAGQLIGLRAQPDAWQLDAPPSLAAAVRPTLLRRALANLMDNAERYGAAPFSVSVARDGTQLAIRVGDRGSGVAPELIERLGQPFLRGDAARGGSGTGLGLSIVARIARLHGGNVRLRNRDNGGFEARIELPLAAST